LRERGEGGGDGELAHGGAEGGAAAGGEPAKKGGVGEEGGGEDGAGGVVEGGGAEEASDGGEEGGGGGGRVVGECDGKVGDVAEEEAVDGGGGSGEALDEGCECGAGNRDLLQWWIVHGGAEREIGANKGSLFTVESLSLFYFTSTDSRNGDTKTLSGDSFFMLYCIHNLFC